MKGRYAKGLAAALAAVALVAGCTHGPAIAFTLDFQQGPSFKLGFGATPVGVATNSSGANSGQPEKKE